MLVPSLSKRRLRPIAHQYMLEVLESLTYVDAFGKLKLV